MDLVTEPTTRPWAEPGTFRLPTRRGRLVGLGCSLAGPVVPAGLVLAAAW